MVASIHRLPPKIQEIPNLDLLNLELLKRIYCLKSLVSYGDDIIVLLYYCSNLILSRLLQTHPRTRPTRG
jgi:hypothetical protein